MADQPEAPKSVEDRLTDIENAIKSLAQSRGSLPAGIFRIALISLAPALAILGFVICIFAYKSDAPGIEKLAYMAMGGVLQVPALVLGFYFGRQQNGHG